MHDEVATSGVGTAVRRQEEGGAAGPSGDLRIVYEGAHQHDAPAMATAAADPPGPAGQHQGGGASDSNNELGAQYFGGARSQ